MSGNAHQHKHAMFGGDVNVFGGSFVNVNGGNGRNASLDILTDAVAHTAFHDSAARFDPPKCHPNTRVAVLDEIMNWVQRCDSKTKDKFVMWLTGAAGAGKSAIAQSFIERCLLILKDLVIASFFFGKADGSRNHAGALVATLAYQIWRLFPTVQNEIISVIDADPLIFTRNLRHQFTQLIAQPLNNICSAGTSWPPGLYRVIVIDGLDECLNKETQQDIIQIISTAVRQFKLPILFFIASRPEHDINVAFTSEGMMGLFTRLYLDDTYQPHKDIFKFLKNSFQEIRMTHPFKTLIPEVWPTPESLRSLVKKASGQFIFAATVIGYVKSIRHLPHLRLDTVMNLRPAQGDLPFAQLDEMYRTILSTAEDVNQVLYALSIYSLGVPDGLYVYRFDICGYLEILPEELKLLFCDLGAIVSIREIRNQKLELQILHASLHDFLLDPARSKQYFIDIEIYRTRHMANLLHYVNPSNPHVVENRDILPPILAVGGFISQNSQLCRSSTELINAASSLPEIFSQSLATRRDFRLHSFLCYDLLPFFTHMVPQDPRWAPIKQQHEDQLDKTFCASIPTYFDSVTLLPVLCIAVHLGTNSLVPGHSSGVTAIFPRFFDSSIPAGIFQMDPLCLTSIARHKTGGNSDEFWLRLVRFIQNPARPGKYPLGGDEYGKAALYFFDELERLAYSRIDLISRFDESTLIRRLAFHHGIWTLRVEFDEYNENHKFTDMFLFLGYAKFFLSLSARSEDLLQHCHEQKLLTNELMKRFPSRTDLLKQEMKAYVERIEGRPIVESPKINSREIYSAIVEHDTSTDDALGGSLVEIDPTQALKLLPDSSKDVQTSHKPKLLTDEFIDHFPHHTTVQSRETISGQDPGSAELPQTEQGI